jgi:tetratricopeptide (TPR) repeat protein
VLRKIHILATAVFIGLTAVSALAQQAPARSAIAEYKKGESAVKAKNWDEAIKALEAAVAIDRNDRPYRDGNIPDKYFPHHYLFVAYAEKGDGAKARENLALVPRATLPSDFATQETTYLARLGGGAAPSGPPPGGGSPAAVDRALAPYNAGIAAMKNNQWQAAITQFTRAIGIDPDDKPRADVPDGYFPHYYIAIANLRLNKIDEAQTNFDKRGTIAKTIYLADEEAKFGKEVEFARNAPLGEDAYSKQNWAAAIDTLAKACNALPDDCNSRGLTQKLADARTQQQRLQAANAVAQRITTARQLMGENDFDGAKREFQAALGSDPNNADAKAGVAEIQTREKNYTDAKGRAQLAMRANPPKLDDAKREYEAAQAAHPRLFQREKLDAALAAVNNQRMAALGIDNTAKEAQVAFQDGRYEAAKQAAETVLAKNPNYADMKSIVTRSESRILYEEGRKIAAAGDFLLAEGKFKEATVKDPSNAVAQKALENSLQYEFLVGRKAYPQARALDRVRFERDRPDLHVDDADLINAANVAFTNADYGSARAKIEEVIQRNPTNVSALGLRRRIVAVTTAAKAADTSPIVPQPTAPPSSAPVLPMWMWGAIAAVTLVGAGSLLMVRGSTPTPVAIDALPWGRVSIQQKGKPSKAAPTEKTTPFCVELPQGEYELHVTNESMSQPYTMKVQVVRGAPNKFVVTMPTYDVDEIVSNLLG